MYSQEVKLLVSLLEAYSPSMNTQEALGVLSDFLGDHGLEARVDCNLTLTCSLGGEPRLLACGHIDTVPGALPVTVSGDVVSGRGAVDAKGPLAAMAAAAARLAGRVDGLLLAAVSDEEARDGVGTSQLLAGLPPGVRWAVVAEPTRGNGVAVSYNGRVLLRLVAEGVPMHVSASVKFPSAVDRCIEAYRAVKEEVLKLVGATPVCPVKVHSEGVDGVMPSSCSMDVDVRIPPGFRTAEVLDAVERGLRSLSPGKRTSVSISVLGVEEPYSVDPESDLVRVFEKYIRVLAGAEPRLIKKLGTSDFNLIGRMRGIPVVAYGPGSPRLSHTRVERLSIREYLAAINVLEAVFGELLQGG